jgi:hypothetical protein
MLVTVVNITLISQFLYIFYSADRQKSVPKNILFPDGVSLALSVWEFFPVNTSSRDVPLYAKFEVPIAMTMKSTYYLLGSHAV